MGWEELAEPFLFPFSRFQRPTSIRCIQRGNMRVSVVVVPNDNASGRAPEGGIIKSWRWHTNLLVTEFAEAFHQLAPIGRTAPGGG